MSTHARRIPLLLACLVLAPAPAAGKKGRPAKAAPAKPSIRIAKNLGKDKVPMVYVPAGGFLRGSTKGEPDVKPQRRITLSAFYIDRFAVTQAQYRGCVQGGKCSPPEAEEGCNWSQEGREQHPVNCVSWNQAEEYCQWAGKGLPSEAQWEKAAVGPTFRTFPWGEKKPGCTLANYYHDPKKKKYCNDGTVPVTDNEKGQSPYGAVQMSGNVYQWVKDWYDKEYYRVSEAKDPMGPHTGQYRVVRGGSWFSPVADLRAAMRGPLPPVMKLNYLGFRCAMYAADAKPPPVVKAGKKDNTPPPPGPHVCYPGGCPLPRAMCQLFCE